MLKNFDIYDFIGFCKSQGYIVSYKAKIGESCIFNVSKNTSGRKLSHRYDDTIHKITWFICDYDILKSELDKLVQLYYDGFQSFTK